MNDKSKDYLLQTVYYTVRYALKAAEGNVAFNSSSVSVFNTVSSDVAYVVKGSASRGSVDGLEVETCDFHIWRTPWLVNFTTDRLPCVGDKLYAFGKFWVVTDPFFTDYDSSGFHQRFRLTCQASKRVPTA